MQFFNNFEDLVSHWSNEDAANALDNDPEVHAANEAHHRALAEKELREAEEHRMIRIKLGKETTATDDEIDQAHQRLNVRPGTTSAWFLAEADVARREEARARKSHETIRTQRREQLSAEAIVKLQPDLIQFTNALVAAMQEAARFHERLMAYKRGGLDVPDFPCVTLLPNGFIDWQVSLARQKFGLDQAEE